MYFLNSYQKYEMLFYLASFHSNISGNFCKFPAVVFILKYYFLKWLFNFIMLLFILKITFLLWKVFHIQVFIFFHNLTGYISCFIYTDSCNLFNSIFFIVLILTIWASVDLVTVTYTRKTNCQTVFCLNVTSTWQLLFSSA